MYVGFEGGTAVGQQDRFDISQMCIAQGRGDAAVGDNAADNQIVDADRTHDVFQSCLVKSRIGNLLNHEIRRSQTIDQRVAETAWGKIAFSEEGAKFFQVRSDQRLALGIRDKRELG